MRKLTPLLVVLGLAGSLWATDPMLGKWKLNLAQSKFSPGYPTPKQEMVVSEAVGDQIKLTITGTAANGSPISLKGTYPSQGGIARAAEGGPPLPAGVTIVFTAVAPGNVYETFLKDGKQIRFNHLVVSKDGKVKQETMKGISDGGKPVDELLVWEKQ